MRTFIAVRIPEHPSLAEPVLKLKSTNEMKTYGPKGLHLTLCFIGDIAESEVQDVIDALNEATDGLNSFDVSVRGMGTFPGRVGARVLWIGAESKGVLETLSEKISDNLNKKGIYHDGRKFVPHVTVGRSKDINGSVTAKEIAEENENREFFSFSCDKITVYSSELRPEGPVHRSIYEKIL